MGREAAGKLWSNLQALGARRLATLALVGIAVLALIGIGTYYLGQADKEPLYTGLDREDIGRIGGALKDAGIDFDVSAAGDTVLVGRGETAHARMLLAEKGLPRSAGSGYELFNQVGSFGLTSFMQEVTKTRALEGELARTIQTMDGIKAARIHLVLPDPGSFRSDQQPASASIVVRTERVNDASSGEAIRHLVAAAVPGLKIDNVTVLNTDGSVLASSDDSESASAGKMAMMEQTVDREIEEKIRRTLIPYVGLGNFQVSVAVRLNMDRRTMSETIFDPASRVERSVRTVKDNQIAQNSGGGAAATVQESLPDQKGLAGNSKASNETNDRREELTNYELSSKTIETTHDGYLIEKLSIAILVNKTPLTASASAGPDAIPVEHQLMDIEQLAGSAAGFTKDRGDVLKVSAVPFVNTGPEAAPEPGIMATLLGQAGSFVNAFAAVVVAILVLLLGLRPAVKAILARPSTPLPPPSVPLLGTPGTVVAEPSLSGPNLVDQDVNLIEDVTKKMSRSPQRRLEQIVEFDEAQAAAILRQWLQQDEAA